MVHAEALQTRHESPSNRSCLHLGGPRGETQRHPHLQLGLTPPYSCGFWRFSNAHMSRAAVFHVRNRTHLCSIQMNLAESFIVNPQKRV